MAEYDVKLEIYQIKPWAGKSVTNSFFWLLLTFKFSFRSCRMTGTSYRGASTESCACGTFRTRRCASGWTSLCPHPSPRPQTPRWPSSCPVVPTVGSVDKGVLPHRLCWEAVVCLNQRQSLLAPRSPVTAPRSWSARMMGGSCSLVPRLVKFNCSSCFFRCCSD